MRPNYKVELASGIFLLLGIAALTSSISLLEVGVAYLVDEKQMARKKAAWTLGGIAFLIGIPSALGNGAVGWLSSLPGVGMDFLSFMFTLFGNYSLLIGALFISIFVAYVWGLKNAADEVEANDGQFMLKKTWSVLIRYLVPIALLAIIINNIVGLF